MKKRLSLFILGFSVFLFFVFFSYLVQKNIFIRFDFDTTVKFQDHVSKRFDDAFSFLSLIGGIEIASLFLLAILILKRKLRGIFVLFSFGAFHFFELFGKTFVRHFPPPEFMLRTERLFNFPQFHVRKEFSYPSGHAGRAVFISVVIFFFLINSKKFSRTQKFIIISFLVLYDFAMFISRIYLGEHWTSDVIGGAILGGSLAILGATVF